MIALTLLTTGFLGIASLLSQSFYLNRVVSDETTATYLAAEGVEIAKNLVDHNVYAHIAGNGLGWNSCFGTGGSFQFDYTVRDCANLPLYDGTPINFDPTTHMYSYRTSGNEVPTAFSREIHITVPNANEIIVNSIVRWSTGSFTGQSVNLEDHFYNWHP